jgi:hypothetical protein
MPDDPAWQHMIGRNHLDVRLELDANISEAPPDSGLRRKRRVRR